MHKNKRIEVKHLTRVEGHGNLTAIIRDGRLKEARFDIDEAPRLFEVFLCGHDYNQVVHMASRICGICAVSHRCAAIKASEAAFGVLVSERIRLLRRLAFHGEVISSHVLHLFFLVAPDMFGVPSVFHLPPEHKDTVRKAMRLKRAALEICRTTAGRHIHPVGMEVGGFSFNPLPRTLAELRGAVEGAVEDLQALVPIFRRHSWPDFQRKTAYVSLKSPKSYAFYEGELYSSRHGSMPVEDYRRTISEYTVPGSTAKHAVIDGASYMVGALARFNNNYEQLSNAARRVADEIGLSAPCTNPFMIPAAQLAETAHCLDESLHLIDRLIEPEISRQDPSVPVHPVKANGVGAVEAPRGTLFHDYTFDERGTCTEANLVIPTAQNLASLHADMQAFIPQVIEEPEEVLGHRLEILTRAYDPCISCSTHVIRLD
ncbi:MAG: Ni/Fe hydrogenase subunit alpha [Desulfobacterales bacterium]|nr:Ni/Fe hydrogenase subunit alpha [Desulfobacterales bacterium]